MWPSERCSVYFCGWLYESVIQDKLLSSNNAVVVTSVLAAVLRDTIPPPPVCVHVGILPIYTRDVFMDSPDPNDHFIQRSYSCYHGRLADSTAHPTWLGPPLVFCGYAYWLEYRWKIRKHVLDLPSPCVLSLRTAHWLITPKCSQQPAGLCVVIASVRRSANK